MTKVINSVKTCASVTSEPRIPRDGRSEYGDGAVFGIPAVVILGYPTGLIGMNAVSFKEFGHHSLDHVVLYS